MDANLPRSTHVMVWLAFLVGFFLPISTALDNIAAGMLLLVWLFSGDWPARWQRLRSNPATYAVAGLLILATVGMAWSLGSTKETLRYFEKYAALILALCLFSLPLNSAFRQRALSGFVLAVVVTVAVSFGFKFGVVPPSWFPGRSPANPVMFKLQITHGFFVAIGAYMLLIRALNETDRRWQIGFGLAAILTAANVLVVGGRTGYVVLAVLLCYLFIQRFRGRGLLLSVAVMGVVILIAQQFPESTAMRRIDTAVDEFQAWKAEKAESETTSIGIRMQLAMTSLRLIAEHPFLGVGTGGFDVAYREAIPEGSLITRNPHNQYLLTAVQLGLVGLGALLALFVVLWHSTGQLSGVERQQARGVLLAYLVGNLFNSFLYDHSEARFFAWAVGLLFCGVAARPSRST